MEKDPDGKPNVAVREAKTLIWGPIYVTLNLEKTSSEPTQSTEAEPVVGEEMTKEEIVIEKQVAKSEEKELVAPAEDKPAKKSVNILSPSPSPAPSNLPFQPDKNETTKKITYIYNLIDHGLDCECIDVKGELLIRSALPVYRKITQGIEFEQITTNQIKLIITSRVLDNYQEVFQGFTNPKATFRIWVMGYKFK
jgi:hypothetical protein